MTRKLVLFVFGIALLVISSTQPTSAFPGPGPGGEPITQALLEVDADGHIQLTKVVWKDVVYQFTKNVEVTESVQENGKNVVKRKTVPETQTATRRVTAPVSEMIPEQDLQLFDTEGKPVSLATVRGRLARPTLVLITSDGKLHPSFAPLFKKDALVFSPPVRAIPAPGIPAPMNAVPPLPPTTRREPAGKLAVQPVRQEKGPPAPTTVERKSPFPNGMSPTFRYCKVQNQGKTVAVRHFFEAKQTMSALRTVTANGVAKLEPYSIVKTIGIDETTQWDRGMVQFFNISGKPLEAAAISGMTQERAVIASGDIDPVDPFWLQNINPDATVIVLPRINYWPAQPPVPMQGIPGPGTTVPPPAAPVAVPPPAT